MTEEIPPGLIKCPFCDKVVKPKHRFHWIVFIILLFVGLLPGLLYWLFRHGKHKCPNCGMGLD